MAPLTVMNWNACSVRPRTKGLVELLQSYEVDVAVITETYLKPGTEWSIPSYNIIRWDRQGPGGGVAILVRKTIQFHQLADTETSVIESLGVELEYDTGDKLKIFAVYCPEKANRDTRGTTQFQRDLSKFMLMRGKYLVAGDLNAYHEVLGNTRPNINGRELLNLAQAKDCIIYLSDEPTYISRANIPSTPDIFLANFEIDTPLAINNYLSDHRPVICKIKGNFLEWPVKAEKLISSRGFLQTIIMSLYQAVVAMFRKILVQDRQMALKLVSEIKEEIDLNSPNQGAANQHDQEMNHEEYFDGDIVAWEEIDEEEVFETSLDIPFLPEVRDKVEKLHGKEAAGKNLLPSKLFKHGGNRLAEGILLIITKIWNQEKLTQLWIETEVRDGHICRRSCCTYSCSILLNAVFRVFSGILFYRLSCGENRFNGQYQARTKRDTLLTLRQVLKECFELKEPTHHLSMDLNALYHSVDGYGLPTKLTLLIRVIMDNLMPRIG